MRLENEFRHGLKSRLLVRSAIALGLGIALSSCGMLSGGSPDSELAAAANSLPAVNGPQADYPITVGAPYVVGATEYIPVNTMNYDEVGFVDADYGAGAGIIAMHHTLPLPSYAEVTSLSTGRTVLVRVERRGPMESNQLLALSQGALAQLGATPGDPVRVRRVNPPEKDRALLRDGQLAPLRMDTPMSLVNVLKRKLPKTGAAPLLARPSRVAPVLASNNSRSTELPSVLAKLPPVKVAQASAGGQPVAPRYEGPSGKRTLTLPPIGQKAAPTIAKKPAPKPVQVAKAPVRKAAAPVRVSTQTAQKGNFVVQAIALSVASKANAVAKKISGQVTKSGSIYRVRTGPFASRAQAEASLAKVRAAGYRDARIFTGG